MDITKITDRALRAISPAKKASLDASTARELLFSASRIRGSQDLPPYYLIYFLLVDLLGFSDSGKWEKTAWSVAVEIDGVSFLIEHRKFGVGVFGVSGPVRRQNICRNSRRRLAESGPRLGFDVRRRACGAASADIRWSFV